MLKTQYKGKTTGLPTRNQYPQAQYFGILTVINCQRQEVGQQMKALIWDTNSHMHLTIWYRTIIKLVPIKNFPLKSGKQYIGKISYEPN